MGGVSINEQPVAPAHRRRMAAFPKSIYKGNVMEYDKEQVIMAEVGDESVA